MIKQFYIVNKSGGMIYKYEQVSDPDVNNLLILTSTIHSLNEISRNVLKTDYYSQIIGFEAHSIYIYRTITNLMFIFVSDSPLNQQFQKIYSHFCDCVLSNPFYQLDMPVGFKKFNPEQFLAENKS